MSTAKQLIEQLIEVSRSGSQIARLQKWVADHIASHFVTVKKFMQEVESLANEFQSPEREKAVQEARSHILIMRSTFAACPSEFSSLDEHRMVSASIYLRLGINYMTAKEFPEGEKALELCYNMLRQVSHWTAAAYLILSVFNQLGMLCTAREDYLKSVEMFKQGSDMYKAWEGHPIPLTDEDFLMGVTREERERQVEFDALYTNTLFYLAQAYSNLKQPCESAVYCRATLDRQLSIDRYDPIEWSVTAIILAVFYLTADNYVQARHCLASVQVLLPQAHKAVSECEDGRKNERKEKLLKTEGDLSRNWVKYCVELLRKATDFKTAEDKVDPPNLCKGDVVKFSTLSGVVDAEEEKVMCELVTDFPAAKEVFLFAQKHILQAQKYYTKESHMAEYIAITQEYSQLFRMLIIFQSDPAVQCRMHKRRIDMLSGIFDELNVEDYPTQARKLCYEIAEVYKQMSGIKIDQGGDSPSSHAATKINMLLQKGIAKWEHFVQLFCDSQGKLPSGIDQDCLQAILTAQINRARMLTSLICSPQDAIRNVTQAIDLYKWVKAYHANHKDEICSTFQENLGYCDEMLKILPQKLEALKIT